MLASFCAVCFCTLGIEPDWWKVLLKTLDQLSVDMSSTF